MLYENDVVQHKQSRARYRIIRIRRQTDLAWLISLDAAKPLPFDACLSALELNGDDAPFRQIVDDGTELLDGSPAALRRAQRRFEMIRPLLDDDGVLDAPRRNMLLQERAAELDASPNTLLRLLRLCWTTGVRDFRALIPSFRKCGSKADLTCGRGRRSRYLDYQVYQLQEQDLAIMRRKIEQRYLTDNRVSIVSAHEELLRESYFIEDGDGKRVLKPEGQCPSLRQFHHFLNKYYPANIRIRKREGDAEFELNHRAVTGSLQSATYSVGDDYEIDATIADVWLVFTDDRSQIIGKPTLYLIVDRRSWLVVGFYVGLEYPSWPAAMHAILSIAEDKAELCRRYGVPFDPDDWPATGVKPKRFVADRGEMAKSESSLVVKGLSIDVTNLPSRRADHKPHVECGFKLIHMPMHATVPGYEPPKNVFKRQGKHYEKDACLTLDEFTAIILKSIIKHNRDPRHNDNWPTEYVLAGEQPTPLNAWRLGIRDRAGSLPRIQARHVHMQLLSRDTATVTEQGVRFGPCFYESEELHKLHWFSKARRNNFNVEVAFDRRLVDRIHVFDPRDQTKSYAVELTRPSRHYSGMSFQEAKAIEFKRRQLEKQGGQTTRQNSADFMGFTGPLAKAAHQAMRDVTNGKSRTSRRSDIKANREAERRDRRQVEAMPPPDHPREPAATGTDPLPSNVIPLPTRSKGVSGLGTARATTSAALTKEHERILSGDNFDL